MKCTKSNWTRLCSIVGYSPFSLLSCALCIERMWLFSNSGFFFLRWTAAIFYSIHLAVGSHLFLPLPFSSSNQTLTLLLVRFESPVTSVSMCFAQLNRTEQSVHSVSACECCTVYAHASLLIPKFEIFFRFVGIFKISFGHHITCNRVIEYNSVIRWQHLSMETTRKKKMYQKVNARQNHSIVTDRWFPGNIWKLKSMESLFIVFLFIHFMRLQSGAFSNCQYSAAYCRDWIRKQSQNDKTAAPPTLEIAYFLLRRFHDLVGGKIQRDCTFPMAKSAQSPTASTIYGFRMPSMNWVRSRRVALTALVILNIFPMVIIRPYRFTAQIYQFASFRFCKRYARRWDEFYYMLNRIHFLVATFEIQRLVVFCEWCARCKLH